MIYQHKNHQGEPLPLPVGKAVCIGRNYLDHIHELNNAVPESPLIFIKPSTAISDMAPALNLPRTDQVCHFETEMAVLIEDTLTHASVDQVEQGIWGYGLGLDLTLRARQSELKEKGHPWEIAKSIDNSCPLSGFLARKMIVDPQKIMFEMALNGSVAQQGDTRLMIYTVKELLFYISGFFTLLPGDVVLTGTPAGVGPLSHGDHLFLTLADSLFIETHVT